MNEAIHQLALVLIVCVPSALVYLVAMRWIEMQLARTRAVDEFAALERKFNEFEATCKKVVADLRNDWAKELQKTQHDLEALKSPDALRSGMRGRF